MRSQPVEVLDFVEHDLRSAYDFYDSWKLDGSGEFRQRFRETIAWIEWNPELFPKRYRFFRRAIIRRTYFAVLFVIEAQVTTVVGVVDMRRNPHELRELLSERYGNV